MIKYSDAKERRDLFMVNYVVIKKGAESPESSKNDAYGICAYKSCGGLLEIIKSVYDISDDVDWLKALADKLNCYGADPIHLCDIIEDELYIRQA